MTKTIQTFAVIALWISSAHAASVNCRHPGIVHTQEVKKALIREAMVVVNKMLTNAGIKPPRTYQSHVYYHLDGNLKNAEIKFVTELGTPLIAHIPFRESKDELLVWVDYLIDNEGNYVERKCRFVSTIFVNPGQRTRHTILSRVDKIVNARTGVVIPHDHGSNRILYTNKVIDF